MTSEYGERNLSKVIVEHVDACSQSSAGHAHCTSCQPSDGKSVNGVRLTVEWNQR